MTTNDEKYPLRAWLYNRNGKLEARDCSIVVGDVTYFRHDNPDILLKSELRERLEKKKEEYEHRGNCLCSHCMEVFRTNKLINQIIEEILK